MGIPNFPGGVIISRDSRNSRNYPNPNDPNNPNYPNRNDPNYPNGPNYPNDPNYPNSPSGRRTPDDNISAELDLMYHTADMYLAEIATKSGGNLYRADTLSNLPLAFRQIAAELRTQYSLGYYPPKEMARDGLYHKIKVVTTHKDVSVRARPGYRAPSLNQ